MRLFLRNVFAVFLLTVFLPGLASAEKRLALVVGNDAYEKLPASKQLKKARNDARAVAGALQGLGFRVTLALDATRFGMNQKIDTFAASIEPGDVAMLFFAGHGVRIGGRNYLLPSDVPDMASGSQDLLATESIAVDRISDTMKRRGARIAILVLDACRNNPFTDNTGRSVGGTRGLARMEPPEGTFVLFSAGAGQEALDRLSDNDGNPNSVFTRSLIQLLAEPGLEVARMARLLRRRVKDLAATVRHMQTPAVYNEITGDFFLAGKAGSKPKTVTGKPQGNSGAALAWNAVKDTDSPGVLRVFIRKFPDSIYAEFAKAKLAELNRTQPPKVVTVDPNQGKDPLVDPGASSSSGGSKAVNGRNVSVVAFASGSRQPTGYFRQSADRRWVEEGTAKDIRFRFNEMHRDEWSVYLLDHSRNVRIQLDLSTNKIMYSVGDGPQRAIYDILESAARPLPRTAVTLPVAGKSWGGVVRAGPGREFAKLDSLREGDPIRILEDSGVVMNNYNWFKISYRGRTGYQWGGILCPVGRPLQGTYRVCDGTQQTGSQGNATAPANLSGLFRLTTLSWKGRNKCLEGNRRSAGATLKGAAHMADCQNVSGQLWKFKPAGNGYFRMTTMFVERENKCFEGNRVAPGAALGGGAFMDRCQNVSGQLWKFVPSNNGYYRMTTQFVETQNKCLEGNGLVPGATLDGAAFMADCGNFSGQLWKFVKQN